MGLATLDIPARNMTIQELSGLVQDKLDGDKAEDIVVIDISDKSSLGDVMIVASGRSSRHVSALCDHLLRELKKAGIKNISIEGEEKSDWILIDIGDVIVHLFRAEAREFYQLEKFWQVDLSPGRSHLVDLMDAPK